MSHLVYLSKCNSTQEAIEDLVEQNNPKIIGAYTFDQTNGKGQYGNQWKIKAGENLAFSFAIPESQISLSPIFINYCTAVSLRQFVYNLTQNEVQIKWPNDLIIHRKKISGILIEKKNIHKNPYFVIGIGLNVLQKDFSEFPKAGSLLSQTNQQFDLHQIAENLFSVLQDKFLEKPSEDDLLNEFNEYLFQKNQVATFKKNGISQNGILKFADKEGYLLIDLEHDGEKKFFHKEIEMLY